MNPLLSIAAEIEDALQSGRPVVALESTVIAHGLPRPHNLKSARKLEALLRADGVVPATIAILDGQVRVGLSSGELERLANTDDVLKVSRRDFPVVVARGLTGATTVAATMMAAHWAGIKVFATGGIGGVHRSGRGDISADLPELARTPVVVVCAGAKAILDLAATLEWLETHGVPVIGYETDEFPAFYARRSGLRLEVRADSPAEVAALVRAQQLLNITSGLLVTVPPPASAALPEEQLELSIASALKAATAANVVGKALTPFLLAHIAEHTGGASLRANLALLENNAHIAAQISVALQAEN